MWKAIERQWEVNTKIQIPSSSVQYAPRGCLMVPAPWGPRFPHVWLEMCACVYVCMRHSCVWGDVHDKFDDGKMFG